jgi:hypothetical protein
MTDLFVIKNIDYFIDSTRKLVFNGFGKEISSVDSIDKILFDDMSIEEISEMDKVLSISETETIANNYLKKQQNKITGKTRYLLTESGFCDIIEDLNSRMVSNILSQLVAKGLMESGYDSELNDFVFWIKDDETTQQDNS